MATWNLHPLTLAGSRFATVPSTGRASLGPAPASSGTLGDPCARPCPCGNRIKARGRGDSQLHFQRAWRSSGAVSSWRQLRAFLAASQGRILKPDPRQTHQVTSTGSVQLQIPPKDTHSGSTSSPPSLAELAVEARVAPNLSGSRLLKFNSSDSPECGHPGTYAAGHVSRGRSGAEDRASGARRRVAYRTGWRQRCSAGLSRWECVRERGRE